MVEFLEYIGMIGIQDSQQIVTGIVRILLAAILGAVIGIERGIKHRPAGVKTHMLVCVASALVMITNEQLIHFYGTGDPTRMGAQVVSGIGFLGAGTILTDKQNRIRGLTTAAGLWASACMGLAIGGGFYIGGITACALMLMIFTKFIDVEQRFVRKGRMMEIIISFDGAKNLNNFMSEITSRDCSITSLEYVSLEDDKYKRELFEKSEVSFNKVVSVNLQILLPKDNYHSEILTVLENSIGMITMEEV